MDDNELYSDFWTCASCVLVCLILTIGVYSYNRNSLEKVAIEHGCDVVNIEHSGTQIICTDKQLRDLR